MIKQIKPVLNNLKSRVLFYLLCLLIFGSLTAFSQTSASGNLSDYVSGFLSGLPGAGDDNYHHPSTSDATAWENCVTQILQGNYSLANSYADDFGYRLVIFSDNTTLRTYYILEKQSLSENYWGMFVYNPSASRPRLFIQAPHPKYDMNTGLQGTYIFQYQDCVALYISGTHRCNSETESDCSGTSSVCGSSGSYRISDQPHNVDGTLQITTEVFENNIDNLIVIQPHGFAKGDNDPDLIMSNGTHYTPSPDYLALIRNSLLVIDDALTFKIAHIDTDWDRLVALTNTQGRLINNSSNPCTSSASSTSGRFIHIEQALSLRDSEAARKKLSDAIGAVFYTETGLIITSPNGHEVLTAGSTYTITWQTTGTINNVKLEYSIDNGTSWTVIESHITNINSYTWTVPAIGTWRGKVRISDVGISGISDESNAAFKIIHTVFPTTGSTDYVKSVAPFGPRLLNGVYDFHRGMDFNGLLDTPIFASRPGVVVRFEDSTQTAGTDRARFGSWMLVQIDSDDGEPRHNSYLHLNGFNGFSVGDTVNTLDTIAFMGKSGYEINTVHLHFELYKDLNGTSISKDKAKNPIELLPYNDLNAYEVDFDYVADSTCVKVSVPDTELDFDEIFITGSMVSRTVGFNSRTGIDPDNNDNPYYNDVLIKPLMFREDSTTKVIKFWMVDSVIGSLVSAKITDINGYSNTVYVSTSGHRYAVESGDWMDAIWASASDGTAGFASIPTEENDVTINDGITVTINSADSKCNILTFGSLTSKLNFGTANSVLSIYGNFIPYSTSHIPFSSWTDGAALRFTGTAETQIIGNIGDSNTDTDMAFFKKIEVDKTNGLVTFAGSSDSKLNLSDSLVIISGTFQVPVDFDINGRSFNGSDYAYPGIKIESGGTFEMFGRYSQIIARSGSDMQSVGKMTVNGLAILASSSSNRIRISDIDIENGGVLLIPYYSSGNMGSGKFDAGTVTIKNGGTLTNSLNTDVWYSGTQVALQSGGVYEATSSVPVMPTFSQNQGTVRYSRLSDSDQTIVDINYYNIEMKYTTDSAKKIWYLGADRSIINELIINNSAIVVILDTLDVGRTLTVSGAVRVNSGSVDNTDEDVTIELAETAELIESSGNTLVGKILTTRSVTQNATNSFGGIGVEINATGAAPGSTTVSRTTRTASTIDGYQSIKRFYDISPGDNTDLNATMVFHYDESELNDISESGLVLYRSTDGGLSWTQEGGSVNITDNQISISGINAFSRWTAASFRDDSLPVILESFIAESQSEGIVLTWTTASEIENLGFCIYRTTVVESYETDMEEIASYLSAETLEGQGTTSDSTHYSYIDKNITINTIYAYYLSSIDYSGEETIYTDDRVEIVYNSNTAIGNVILAAYILSKAYPMPFNNSFTIPFILNENMSVSMSIYDLRGRQVRNVMERELSVGDYNINVIVNDLSSGVYILNVVMGGAQHNQRIVLLK